MRTLLAVHTLMRSLGLFLLCSLVLACGQRNGNPAGPSGSVDAREHLEGGADAVLNEDGLRLLNRALSLAGQRKQIPQVDVELADGFPNFTSTIQSFDRVEATGPCPLNSWRRGVSVSAMNSVEPPRRSTIFVAREVLEGCPTPRLTDTIFAAKSDVDFASLNRFNAKSPAFETKTHPDVKPFSHYTPDRGGRPLFTRCEVVALNASLARIARDPKFDLIIKFDKRSGWQTRSIALNSFLGTGARLGDRAKFVLNFTVRYDHFDVPYTFKVDAQSVGQDCRLTAIDER